MMKLVEGQGDLGGGENFLGGPFGDFFGALLGGLPAGDGAEVDDAAELLGELAEGEIVGGAPVAKL